MAPCRIWLSIAAAVLAACGDSNPAPRGLRNVLLITLDTTRYNALGCYGNPKLPTPNLDRLATESVIYDRARTVVPLTMPAHASMLTGLYPCRHGVHGNGLESLPSSATTLAELARSNDIETAAFVAGVVLDPALGLAQGFDTYESPPRAAIEATRRHAELRAPEVVERARRWLAKRDRKRSFFAWMHFFDAHAPYEPPAELAQAMSSAYLGEIAAIDRALGPFLDELRSAGTLDETLVIVVADHGESLTQHGEQTHGWYCYDSTLRVPFFVRYPDRFRAGERSRELVGVVDVFPTALAALGIPVPEGLDGQSLFRATVAPERGLYFELFNGFTSFGWSPLVGWIDASGKYIHSSSPEFYDLERDKGEAKDVSGEHAADVARAKSEIAAVRARPKLAPDAEPSYGEDLRSALRSLGYVGVDGGAPALPDPLAPSELPSPRSRRGEMELFQDGLTLADQGNHEEAVKRLSELTTRYPENALARSFLANSLIQLQRCAEARALLEKLVQEGRARSNDYNSLGWCREKTGDQPGAIAAYQRALELDPGQPWARENLERVTKR